MNPFNFIVIDEFK